MDNTDRFYGGTAHEIDRLIGILSISLQKETITAPVLAEQFEVSRRTISRDIDTLCQAGIPIVTRQGINGGISISVFRNSLTREVFDWAVREATEKKKNGFFQSRIFHAHEGALCTMYAYREYDDDLRPYRK